MSLFSIHNQNKPKKEGFFARIFTKRAALGDAFADNNAMTLADNNAASLDDCGCLPPEGLADGKQPTQHDIDRAANLNKRFEKFKKELGLHYRAFCGGKAGIMVRKYVPNCLSDGRVTFNTTDLKPIGIGPSTLNAWFEKAHGISFNKFENDSEGDVKDALAAHGKKVAAELQKKLAGKGGKRVKKAVAEAKEAVDEAKQEVPKQEKKIKEAKEKIKKVKEQRKKNEVPPSKAEQVIEQQERVIERAEEKIEEVKAEAQKVVTEAKQDAGGSKLDRLAAMFGKFENELEAV